MAVTVASLQRYFYVLGRQETVELLLTFLNKLSVFNQLSHVFVLFVACTRGPALEVKNEMRAVKTSVTWKKRWLK